MSQSSTDIPSKQFSFPEVKCESDQKKKKKLASYIISKFIIINSHPRTWLLFTSLRCEGT